nr:sugar phosphate isomerase/epimerase [bacterium]
MKTCLHSVGYSGTWGNQASLSLEGFIDKAAELGVDAVELAGKRPHASPLDLTPRRLSAIRHRIADRGLTVACIASYHDWATYFDHMDMAYQEKELVYLKAVLQMASALGAPIVRTYTGFMKEGVPYRKQWDTVAAGLRQACAMAADYGITLALQNHSCIASAPDALLDLIKEVGADNLKVSLEATYIDAHGFPMEETVKRFKGLAVHTHLLDVIRRPVYAYRPENVTFEAVDEDVMAVPLGQGIIDYEGFIRALAAIDYPGVLCMEMCTPLVGGGSLENLDNCIRQSKAYIEGVLAKL